MAVNPIPRSSFTLQFGVLSAVDQARGLTPAFIAPRYAVHKVTAPYNDSSDTYLGEYTGEAATFPWPNREEASSVVDASGSELYSYQPLLKVNNTPLEATTKAGQLNVLTFTKPVASGNGEQIPAELRGYNVVEGDQLSITKTGGTTILAQVVDVQPTVVPAAVDDPEALSGNTGSGALTGSGTFTGVEDCSYLLQVTKVEDASVEFEASAIAGDQDYHETITLTAATAQAVGNYGAQVMAAAVTGFAVGDSYVMRCSIASPGAKNIVYIDKMMDSDFASATLEVTVNTQNIVTGLVEISAASWSANAANGINTNAVMTVRNGSDVFQMVSGSLFVKYRERLVTDTMQLLDSRVTGASDWVGEADPENPLGLMWGVANAINPGGFYVLAVPDNSDESYLKAIEYVGTFEEAFAPITYDQDEVIQSALIALVKKYSDPYIAQFKKAWLIPLTQRESVVYDKAGGESLLGQIENGVLTLESPGDVVTGGVRLNDIVTVKNVYNTSTGVYEDVQYTVTSIVSNTAVGVANAANTTRVAQVSFSRMLSNMAYAQAMAAEASKINSPWVNMVWSDTFSALGFSDLPGTVLCCALAALRSLLPPHAPLSDVTIPGITITNTLQFGESEYETLNTGGVWAVRNDAAGSAVTVHQITTLTDGTIAEEDSVVSNAVSIARELRAATKKYGANVNISDQLVDQIRADLIAVFTQIQGRVYAAIYGPQLEDYDIITLKRDPSNKQRLLCKLDGSMPLPLIDSDFVFSVN